MPKHKTNKLKNSFTSANKLKKQKVIYSKVKEYFNNVLKSNSKVKDQVLNFFLDNYNILGLQNICKKDFSKIENKTLLISLIVTKTKTKNYQFLHKLIAWGTVNDEALKAFIDLFLSKNGKVKKVVEKGVKEGSKIMLELAGLSLEGRDPRHIMTNYSNAPKLSEIKKLIGNAKEKNKPYIDYSDDSDMEFKVRFPVDDKNSSNQKDEDISSESSDGIVYYSEDFSKKKKNQKRIKKKRTRKKASKR